jgi:D-beta-D-heptose 7-phosphate kinase/D-beta-D-heptose 1-phosphate adenosyltransferase|tara:strand:- start:1115 stop:1852 length:738 start_codon:yes stop_codon:yes gene_type:complete
MKKILVIGETCRDVFCYGKAERLCPEAPAPVFNPISIVESPGMAMNVQRNIIALGTPCDILTNPNWEQIVKTRYIHKNTNQMFIRIDVNDEEFQRCDISKARLDEYDAIVISDYCKGYLTEEDIYDISAAHKCVFLDTKRPLDSWCDKVSFIKINEYEYERTKKTVTKELQKKLIVTLGSRGCEHAGKIYKVETVDIKDVTGAGDTFVGALAVEYVKNHDIESAIKYANQCATKVVQKRGVNIPA